MAAYREAFQPSEVLDEPYLMLGTSVLCAPTDEEARFLAGPGHLAITRLRQGVPDVYPTPEEAAAHTYSPAEQATIDGFTRGHVVGPPDEVRAGLEALVARTGADELMITTNAHGLDDRLRSHRLVAEVMGLAPVAA